MTRRLGPYLCLLLALLTLTPSFAAARFSGRVEIEREVSRLWNGRQFDELDSLEKSLRMQNAQSDSGWPELFMFYQALEGMPGLEQGSMAEFDRATKDTEEWLSRVPSSQFGRFLKADLLMAHAWRERGRDYANTVSEGQWKRFNAYMDEASQYLVQQKASLSSNPNWYSAMLDIANGQSWPKSTYDALLNEAVRRHGRYLPILTQSVEHFTPKWGGSYREMNDFIESSTSRFTPSENDELYARQYSYAFENSLYPDLMVSSVSCKRWLRGYEEILRKYPTRFNVSHAAFAAFKCADKPMAVRYLQQLGDSPPDLSVWGPTDEAAASAFSGARRWATGAQ